MYPYAAFKTITPGSLFTMAANHNVNFDLNKKIHHTYVDGHLSLCLLTFFLSNIDPVITNQESIFLFMQWKLIYEEIEKSH